MMSSDLYAFLLVLVFILTFAVVIVALERRTQERRANSATNSYGPQTVTLGKQRNQHPSEEEHRTAEQQNWRQQNRFTIITVCSSTFAAIAAFAAFLVAQGQLTAMRDEQRPWVYTAEVPEIYGGLEIIPPNGAQIHMRFILQNSGHIPATQTHVSLRFINNANGWPFDRDGEQKLACDITLQKGTWASGNVTVFPGRPQEVDTVVVMEQRQVEIAAKGIMPPNWKYMPSSPGMLSPFIVGCIQYQFGDDSNWHVTPINYYVTYITTPDQPDTGRFAIPFSDVRMTILPNRLRILNDIGPSARPPT